MMKKKYEKPNLTMFSLIGNENICGGCDNGIKLSQDTGYAEVFDRFYGNLDGVLTKEEASNLFGLENQCSTKIEGYCKFTSAEFTSTVQKIAWS